MTELHQLLQQNRQVVIAAINGMGGVGKTELAIQYAREHLADYPGGICWVNAQGILAGTQIIRFAEIKFKIVLPDGWELADQLQFCWQKWQPGDVLFIFDDVFNYKQQVKPFLPNQSRFKVLLTTRFQFDSTLQQLRLDVLKPLAAMRLLKSIVGRERLQQEPKIARSLCQFLGYLPLALELVGRYLDLQPNLSLAKLLRRLEKQRLDHAALIPPKDGNDVMRYELGVEAAINLSWEKLDENAKNVGCYLSLYALAAIPFSTEWIEDEDEQEEWEKALRDLRQWHLLQEVRKETYRLHPLIRQFLQKRLDELAEAEEWKRSFAASMVAVAREIDYQLTREDVINFSPWIPHIEEVANNLAEFLDDEDLITPFNGLGKFYYGQSFSQQAEVWYQQCRDIVKQRLGEEHPDFATILNYLAELYHSLGRYSEAEPLYLQALSIDRQSLPENHPLLATHLNNLALLYKSQGRYSEAEPLYLQAWEILQRSLGAEHPNTVTLRRNLAKFWSEAINENRADLEVLQNNPLFLEIMREFPAENPPDD